MSEEELEEYYFGRIDLDTPDHVFVERALADYRAFRCLGKYDDDADWQPAALDDGHSDYDLPECDAVRLRTEAPAAPPQTSGTSATTRRRRR